MCKISLCSYISPGFSPNAQHIQLPGMSLAAACLLPAALLLSPGNGETRFMQGHNAKAALSFLRVTLKVTFYVTEATKCPFY